MNAIRLVLYVVIGILLANFITYLGYVYLIKPDIELSNKNTEHYNGFQKPKFSVTIKNGSDNHLTCGTMKNNTFDTFLHLDSNKERSYDNINEGENVGCSINIDNRSSTVINWFYIKSPGLYTLLLEQIECKSCKGTNYTWTTVVVTPNGEREYRQF